MRKSPSLLVVAAAILCAGCEATPEGRVPVHRVRGQVKFQGKPLKGAAVTFCPVDETTYGKDVPWPTGRTDEDGAYALTTYALEDGAPIGSYLVGISSVARPRTETGLFSNSKGGLPNDVLKGRYTDPKKSGIRAEVKAGDNRVAPFELH